MIVPGILVTLGLCTLTNNLKKEGNDAGSAGYPPGSSSSSSLGGGDEVDDKKKKKKHSSRGQQTSYKALAKKIDVEWVQRSLEKIAVQLEHATAVTMWEDPIATTAFVASTLAATVVLAYVPFKFVILTIGLYHARPPSWRAVPGPVDNILSRMPDKTEEYTRLMMDVNRGAAAGA